MTNHDIEIIKKFVTDALAEEDVEDISDNITFNFDAIPLFEKNPYILNINTDYNLPVIYFYTGDITKILKSFQIGDNHYIIKNKDNIKYSKSTLLYDMYTYHFRLNKYNMYISN